MVTTVLPRLVWDDLGVTYETGRPTDADASLVETRDDFAAFVSDVLADFAERGGSCEWENGTLDRFLDGMAAFAAARLQGGADQEKPTWKLFAEIIAAGTAYE